MSIYIGNTKIGQMYLGSTEIAEAYLGSTKVYDKGGLPYDAQVEYLESSGTQYIDTGYIPNNETGFCIRAFCTTTGGNHMAIGVRENSGDTRLAINYSAKLEIDWNTYEEFNIPYTNVWTEVDNNFLNTRMGKIDGVIKRTNYPTLANITKPIYMFAINYSTQNVFTGRISNAKISQGQDIVMDLIPVRVGQVGYMYDQVSGQLFGNAGTGNFVLGNDVS